MCCNSDLRIPFYAVCYTSIHSPECNLNNPCAMQYVVKSTGFRTVNNAVSSGSAFRPQTADINCLSLACIVALKRMALVKEW